MPLSYRQLDSGQIRLLRFLDGTGLHCTIEEYALKEAPAYVCLSYAWKIRETDETQGRHYCVTIDGQQKEIQFNLHGALRYLGHVAWSKGLRLWVDAICINQDDLEERSEQVKLMKVLYEKSEEVHGWVGYSTAETESAVGMMKSLASFPEDFFSIHGDKTGLTWWTWWQELFGQQPFFQGKGSEEVLAAWEATMALLKRRYWSRTWVQQEATLEKVRFYCGEWSFTWQDLHAVRRYCEVVGGLRSLPDKYLLVFAGGATVGSPFLDLANGQISRQQATRGRTLPFIIRELRQTFCLDGRDKVFAAIPHAVDVQDGELARKFLDVDHTKDIANVYTDVARFCLEGPRGLEILGFVSAPPEPGDSRPPRDPGERPLPSWVPDWRIPNRIRPLNCTGLLHGDYALLYEPCPGTALEVTTSETQLGVRGFVFDTIEFITSSTGREYIPSEFRAAWGGVLEERHPQFTQESFTRTLNADAQHVWSEEEDRWINARGGSIDWRSALDKPVSEVEGYDRLWRLQMRHVVRGICRDRRAGCTRGGKMGIFPEACQAGDRVAAIFGGNTLYVVRSVSASEGEYRFLGECFVDGMMDGQVMNLANANGIQSTTLILV